ncbi:MAG: hypothetical protein ACR2HC_07645 [Thermoleophilaceae bacterium]
MSPEDPGLLGNLPRSRPGTRSDKRGSAPAGGELIKEPGSAAKAAPKRKPAAKAKPGVKAKRATKAKPTAPPPTPPQAPREPVAAESHQSGGPLRSVAKVAGTGLRVAEGVTREVLRRLPRP